VKESRKGWARSVSLVDAVVEPAGHYCRSSDAAVLPCVRIIAPRYRRCSCLRGVLRACCAATVATARRRERKGRKGTRKDGAFLAFSLSAPHVGKALFVGVFLLILLIFLLGSRNQDKNKLGFSKTCRSPPESRRACHFAVDFSEWFLLIAWEDHMF
jgi:hypothetical protein